MKLRLPGGHVRDRNEARQVERPNPKQKEAEIEEEYEEEEKDGSQSDVVEDSGLLACELLTKTLGVTGQKTEDLTMYFKNT